MKKMKIEYLSIIILFFILICITFFTQFLPKIYIEVEKKEISINSINDEKDIIINEISIYPSEAIEIKNNSNHDINLLGYSICDKSNKKYFFKDEIIKKNDYYVIDSNLFNFKINNNDTIYLYKNNSIVDMFDIGKLPENISVGINKGEKVYYKDITLGKDNSNNIYLRFSQVPLFNINGGYVNKGAKISLETNDDSTIYYTLDGSFPTKKSIKYEKPILINKDTVIKAISYKEGFIESDIVSRTFIVNRKHTLAYFSISASNNDLFSSKGIFTDYLTDQEKKANIEFYESDGTIGLSFIADIKITGSNSRLYPQKSISVSLKRKYGISNITYPFFNDMNYNTYSSFILRNAGEDPKGVRIMDAALTRVLKGKMDIDMQEYRPVVVYINGNYYGIYNLREKLNEDYIESKFGYDKDDVDILKMHNAVKGSKDNYNDLIIYASMHDASNSIVYEELKKKIDIEEFINYWVVESFYGNIDLANIRYWKSPNSKWRWMLFDLDRSFEDLDVDIGYPVKSSSISLYTYIPSSIMLIRNLYRNSIAKDIYLKTLSYHLKNTFNPSNMNRVIDELAKEIENEMPYHIKRWGKEYKNINSMERWKTNISNLKQDIARRYERVINNLQKDLNLTDEEYKSYFKDL